MHVCCFGYSFIRYVIWNNWKWNRSICCKSSQFHKLFIHVPLVLALDMHWTNFSQASKTNRTFTHVSVVVVHHCNLSTFAVHVDDGVHLAWNVACCWSLVNSIDEKVQHSPRSAQDTDTIILGWKNKLEWETKKRIRNRTHIFTIGTASDCQEFFFLLFSCSGLLFLFFVKISWTNHSISHHWHSQCCTRILSKKWRAFFTIHWWPWFVFAFGPFYCKHFRAVSRSYLTGRGPCRTLLWWNDHL